MNALRTTTTDQQRPVGTRTRLGVLLTVALGLYGCGSATHPDNDAAPVNSSTPMPGSNDPSWLTTREKLPPPDTDRIEFDKSKRMLILYELPGRDSWMVQLPDDQFGRLVGTQFRLPEGTDTSRTLVYYSRAGMKISAPVTVAQIEAGRLPHTSMALGN